MTSEVLEKKAPNQQEKPIIGGPQQMTIKGALIGATITAFISWNSGRYSKIGQAIKRFKFTRNFINYKKFNCLQILTKYNQPQLNAVANNFFCYSGQPGIGKSFHFRSLASRQSLNRPVLYLSFKTVGRDSNFQSDVSQQLSFGEDGTAIISQIIRAVKRIHLLNTKPEKLWIKYSFTHVAFIGSEILTFFSNLDATIGILALIGLGFSHFSYTYFVHPFMIQSFRKTTPLIILDDMNKVQHLNMLSQIVRFLKLIQQNSANVMLVSSDQETWSKLRREPGMKDRLRVRQLKYDHQETCKRFLEIVNNNYPEVMRFLSGHKVYDQQIITGLVKQLIGVRQVTLRRFMGIVKLNDEQQYERLLTIIKQKKQKSLAYVISEFTKVIFQTEMETMVSNLKTIKRQLSTMTWEQFIKSLNILLTRYKLPSDDKVGPYLKAYNIVRDLRSQYVINGRFNYIIYQMAVQEYLKDLKDFDQLGKKLP